MRPVALLLVIAALGCGRTSGLPFEDQTPGGVFCGPGTHLYGSECLPDGPGTSGGAGSGSGGSGGFGGSGGGMRDMASGNDGGNQGGPATGDMAVPPIGDRAVAWQIDPAHSGGQPNTRLRPPLVRLWSYDAGGPISYPLVSDGRVFVPSGGGGSYIAALDSVTGARLWGPIALGGSYNQAASAAYDVALARLFVQNANGMVEALDPATGTSFWTEQLSAFEVGAITAQGGLLFVPGDWSTTVLDGKSGAMRWNGGFSGTPNAPALTPSAVYTCAIGGYVGANDPATGARVWTHAGGGDGGGGCFTVVGAGHVYFADWADAPVVLDANIGSVVGSFPGAEPPAIDGKHAYFLVGPNLQLTGPPPCHLLPSTDVTHCARCVRCSRRPPACARWPPPATLPRKLPTA